MNGSKRLVRNNVILSRFLKISTGCRGVPQPHHEISYNYEEYQEETGTRNNFVFPANSSQIHLILYDGPELDTTQKYDKIKSTMWVRFFEETVYKNRITWKYQYSSGLPRGLVFNHRKNELVNFENHLDLDGYFRAFCYP